MGVGEAAFEKVVVDVHTTYLFGTSKAVSSAVAAHDLKLIHTPPTPNIAARNQSEDGCDSYDW